VQVVDCILGMHSLLGHDRQILQMDVGGTPHDVFLRSIELLGTGVLPQVRTELTSSCQLPRRLRPSERLNGR
jgi:hypothetical protein